MNAGRIMKTALFMVVQTAVILLCPALSGQTAGKTLPLETFIRLAAERNTAFEEILIDELPLQYTGTLALPADDLILSVKGQYMLMLEDGKSGPEYGFGLDKLFPATATRLSASYSADQNFGSANSESTFRFAIVQPIAENAFGKANHLIEKLSGIENDVARHQIAEAYEDYLASLITLYYDWYASRENLATATAAYKDAKKQLDNIRERAKNSIALPIDVNKIKVQTVSRKEQMVSLNNDYEAKTNLVMEAIRASENERPEPETPKKPRRYKPDDFNRELDAFLLAGRTTRILDLLEDKAGTEVAQAADRLLPSVNLTAGYEVTGENRFFSDPEQGFFAGITLEWPLPQRQETARHEISRINRQRVSLSGTNTRRALETSLKNLSRSIENQYRLIELAEEKISISDAIVKDEKKNYSLGKTNLNDLIDEVNRLEGNRFNLISREIELRKLIVEWKRLSDTLVRTRDIMPEHFPATIREDIGKEDH